ncbi:MAG: HAD family phosphatase [Clostridia bacterium]|nr:HAD family phosphatase [Clostridia bacterium]
MIRNIVFDMGQVILKFDPKHFIDREKVTDPEDRKLILNELFLSVEWAQMDAGTLTEETAEPSILERFPERLRGTVRNLLYNWAYPRETIPGMEETVRALKDAGYGIYLLSNASKAQHDYWPRVPVSEYFDGKLISCDVKVVKPCHRIYELFTEKFGLKPEECIFIDDSTANAAAAIACGWQGIVFHGDADELRQKLRKAGVRI